MNTVAAISFLADRSLSMDVLDVTRVDATMPVEAAPGVWCTELVIRTANGTVAIQMTAEDPDKLRIIPHGLE